MQDWWSLMVAPLVVSEETAQQLNKYLKQLGIHLKTSSQKKNLIRAKTAVPNPSLIGRECRILLDAEVYERLAGLLCPHADAQAAAGTKEHAQEQQRAGFVGCMAALSTAVVELTESWEVDTDAERTRRAAHFRECMLTLMRKAKAHIGEEAIKLYTHIGLVHIPDMILRHGSLGVFVCQNLEHVHSRCKRAKTNRRFFMGSGSQRAQRQLLAASAIASRAAGSHPSTEGTGRKRLKKRPASSSPPRARATVPEKVADTR